MAQGDEIAVKWRQGFRGPRGVSAEMAYESIKELPEPSPEHLVEAARRKRHPLHEDLWGEDEATQAAKWRMERARHILAAVHVEFQVGPKTMETRAVEFIRTDDNERWAHLEEIVGDPDLLDAYEREVEVLLGQAQAKIARVRQLRRAGASVA